MSRTTRSGTWPSGHGLSLGEGWAWPTDLRFLTLASIYLPGHTGRATGVGVVGAQAACHSVASLLQPCASFDALLLRLVERELAGRDDSSADAERVVHVLRTAFHRTDRTAGVAAWPAGPMPTPERTSS